MKFLRIFYCCSCLVLIIGCGAVPLEKAFHGEFSEVENNRVIYDYCQSCHIHKVLIPIVHVTEKNQYYQTEKFRKTNQCRTCHYIEKSFWGDVARKTIRPKNGMDK